MLKQSLRFLFEFSSDFVFLGADGNLEQTHSLIHG